MKFDTTEEAADAIYGIIQNEGETLGAECTVEQALKRDRTNEMVVSLKKDGRTFRITYNWVRDENVSFHGYGLGVGYIEREWSLSLCPENPQFPVIPPFVWELKCRDESVSKASHPRILDEPWLRRLIRKKLAVLQDS